MWNRTVHVSDSFSAHNQESSTVHIAIGICHTGYAKLSVHVEFYSKNKVEKLVHLVGFIISIYHDAGPLNVKFGIKLICNNLYF